jgi:hypothetical protein
MTAPGFVGPVPCAAEGAGVVLWFSVVGPLEELLMLKAEPMASPTCTIAWRAGGTTDRITPTANTAAPTAKAGRSIASRQSLGRCASRPCASRRCASGRCAAGRGDAGRTLSRRSRAVTEPAMASQIPSTPLGRLARAG